MVGDVARVLVVVAIIALAAQPIARAVLAPLPGAAAGFARPLGLLLAAVPLWLLASLGLVRYTRATAWIAVAALAVAGAACARRERRRAAPAPEADRAARALLIGAEATFAACMIAGILVVSHAPDVWQTEKPMDMAIVNAIDGTREFPPQNPWLSGAELDYYYFGQYLVSFVIRLAGLGPTQGYNLAIALVWALTAAAAFGLGGAATAALGRGTRAPVLGGCLAALLVAAGSNPEGLRLVLGHGGPLKNLDWFAASRVVPGGINDFPAFELLVGDVHAHVIAAPVMLLALAFVLHALIHGPRLGWPLVVTAVVVGSLYPIGAWAFPVCLGLLVAAGVLHTGRGRRVLLWAGVVAISSVVVYLPFHLGFDTGGARGLAVNPDRRGLADFGGDLLRVYGFALVPVLVALVVALPRPARWPAALFGLPIVVLAAVTGGDLGGPVLLAGALAGAAFAAARAQRAEMRFAFLLAAGGLACALLPELVYVRDAFDGTQAYRLNTLHKLGWSAWILLGVSAAVLTTLALAGVAPAARRRGLPGLALVGSAALAFSFAGAYARTDGFSGPATFDGLRWLDRIAPGDRAAIAWLRANARKGAVILEAHGPEYSLDGYARISTFTGRATVLGWAEHLLFWGAPPLGTRAVDVRALYSTSDLTGAAALLRRYSVAYVVVGPLERATYPASGLAKFATLGRRVHAAAGTAVYDVERPKHADG